ncbi:MAG: DNA translocase FtsK [Bacteroidales bacterium]|nr:DNA translocase FtsK [Bacteroidales bacterium]
MLGKSKDKKKEKLEAEKPSDEPKTKKSDSKKKGKDGNVADDGEGKVKRSDQIKICIGVLLLAFVIIMVLSFISYFFTWKEDQSLSNYGFFKALFASDVEVGNKAGKLGAVVANFFIRDTFGIASFAIVAMLVAISLRLLNIRKVRLLPFIIKSAFIMLWFSIALASIFRDNWFMLGGKHGYFMFTSLRDLVGGVGAYAIIVVLALFIVIFCFENSVVGIKKILERISAFRIKDIKDKLGEDEETPANPQNQTEPAKPIDPILPIEPSGNTDENPTNPDEIVETDTETPTTIDFDGEGVDNNAKQRPTVGIDDGFEINHGGEEEPDEHGGDEIIDTPDEVEVPENPIMDGEGNVELDITETAEEPQANPEDWTNLPDYDPTMDLEFYKFPTADLLPDIQPKDKLSDEELKLQLNSNKDRIVQTLSDYGIAISKISATVGPTVTLYEIVPAPGVRISKIKNLEDDIALSLAALGIRIIAPIPGKGTIGIEVPNPKPETVSMRSVISSKKFQESKYDLPVALGKTITNETYVFNLAKTPHLLVAGATGQGKSVGINAIIASLLYKKHPSQLKFVLVDPKMVELSIYKAIEKHYLAKLPGDNPSIITDVSKVTEAMNSLCILMDERYELLTKAGCRNINEYNEKFIKRKLNPEKGHYYMFYIVVVIDEFADIIVQEGRQVETPISRLAAKARAIGIHLIVATQRPSTNVITGVIKANFPSRIAFKVTNYIDSKTILDQTGANQLIGRGDLLISYGGEITRVQCAFIDTPEVQSLVDFISAQQGYPCVYELPEVKGEGSEDGGGSGATLDPNNRDPLFDEAARLICESQQGSTSMLQRKFSIGYNRAGKIIDQLEAAGIVGPYEGSKARQVMYDITSLERYLEELHGNN